MRTLEEHWEHFVNTAVPPTTTDKQLEEVRKIYYAGSTAMYALIYGTLTDRSLSREKINEILKAILAECQSVLPMLGEHL